MRVIWHFLKSASLLLASLWQAVVEGPKGTMRLTLLAGLPFITSGVTTFITSGRMDFGACQDYCEALGAVVACVETDEDQTMLNGLLYESDCDEYWVGYTDTDNDGEWTWPYGCSSTRVYGECGSDAPCGDHSGHCVTLNDNVAYCYESSQCCACSETETPAPTVTPAPTPAPSSSAPTVTHAPTIECPYTLTESGKCLFVSEHYYNFAECQNDFCAPNGGVVACIENDEENEVAKDVVGDGEAWIGINDGQTEGEWGWVSCSSEFTAWYSGEPNDWGGCEDCATVSGWESYDDYYYNDDGSWNDLSCTSDWVLCLCEYGGAPVSETFDAWALLEDQDDCEDSWWDWYDDDEYCSREWCTSEGEEDWHDCWAGTPGERCTCARGEARLTGETYEDDGTTHCEYRRRAPCPLAASRFA